MTVELNRTTFRRLVQVNWLALVAVVPLGVWQALSQGWNDFDAAFTKLLQETYGRAEPPDWLLWTSGALLLAHVAALIGIYWFQPWARWMLWATVLIMAVLDTAFGQAASYAPAIETWLGTIGDAVFGAVVLASYCQPVANEFSGQRAPGELE